LAAIARGTRVGIEGETRSGARRANNMKRLIARTVAGRQGGVLKVCDTRTRTGRVHRTLD